MGPSSEGKAYQCYNGGVPQGNVSTGCTCKCSKEFGGPWCYVSLKCKLGPAYEDKNYPCTNGYALGLFDDAT